MFFEILFFLLIVLSPLGYIEVAYFLEKLLVESAYRSGVLKIHNYIFAFIQLILCIIGSYFAVSNRYILELLGASLVIWFMLIYYQTKLYKFYENISNKKLILQIFGILIVPVFIMNFVRNFFDTYYIGLLLFNINNFAVLLWEVIILSLLNITHIAWIRLHDIRIFIGLLFILYGAMIFI